ncbi:hypothetical protein PCE31107_02730 [Pandoraea cepalis]|uniref:Uncharacterized protein n=1 Tax=Pandoraea cepalis TaxID=2508294 RepID=A0A5E4VLY1_9BURK|nr:hypothetical protein PCE31107_02730 [Pandoraea cepalis]
MPRFAVYAKAVSPGIPGERGGRYIGFPIAQGNVNFIAGDRDGVVSVPFAIARDLLETVSKAEQVDRDLAEPIAMFEKEPAYISEARQPGKQLLLCDANVNILCAFPAYLPDRGQILFGPVAYQIAPKVWQSSSSASSPNGLGFG